MSSRIAPQSDIATTHNVDVASVVLDPDSNNDVAVLLMNSSQKIFQITTGDEIVQLIFEQAATPAIKLLSNLNIYFPTTMATARSA